MDAIEAVKTRRSVRRYESKPVEESKLREIMECARQAPSACNIQPCFFFVVRSRAKIVELSKTHKYSGFLANAPVVIASCADDKASEWYVQDTCAAIENVLVSARALGLGTCWVGVHKEDEPYAQKALGTKLRVINLIGLGYPAENPSVRKKEPVFKFVD